MGITTNLRKSPAKVTTRKAVASRRSLTGNKPLLKDLTLPTQQCSNIKVAIRVRPQNEREVNSNQRSVIKIMGDRMLIFDPKAEEDDFFFHGAKVKARDLNKKENRNVDFNFDRVFGMESTNEEVFEGTTKEVVQAVMDGYNCSVFAYGATGAGKTHSMVGTTSNPGIIFLTVMELYNRMEALKIDTIFEVSVSYLEVYNETIRDLLANSEPLNIRDDGNNGFAIPGLSLHKPGGATDLLSMLEHGNKNRSQHPTDHNAESSRSHAVFQIWIKQRDKAAVTGQCRVAKMSLIDLAGSERGSSTNFKGERFREGTNINRSLLALGNCINALAEGRKHINYRDSKLTRLLKDSLGGNCKTVMIAAVSPSNLTYEDTYNTLRYADRAKKIKSVIKKNIRSVEFHMSQYEQIITDLRSQVDHLKNKLQETENKLQEAENVPPSVAPSTSHCIHLDSTFQAMKRQLDSLFHEKREVKRKLMQLATEENKLHWRDAWNQVNNQRSKAINFDIIEMERFATKTQRFASITSKKLAQLEVERAKQEERLAEYDLKIKELVDEWKQLGLEPLAEEGGEDVKTSSSQMELVVRMKQLEVQVQDLQDRQVHQQRLTESQAVEEKRSENLMGVLLKTLKQQHLQLKLHDKLLPIFEDNYKNLVSMVEARNVNWPDQHTESLEVSCPAPLLCATLPKLFEMLPILEQSVQLSPLAESQMLTNKQTLTTTSKASNFSVLPCISNQEKPISSLKSASSSVQLSKVASATPPTPPVSTKVATSLANYQNSPELKPKSLPVLQPTITTWDCTCVQEETKVEELCPHLDATVVLEKASVSPISSNELETDLEVPLHAPEEEEKEQETLKFATLNAINCLGSPAKETDNGLDATYVTNAVYREELVRERSSSHPVISKSMRRETFDAEPCMQIIHPTIVPLKDKENFAVPAAPKPLLPGKSGNNHTPSKLVAVVRRALTPKMKKTVSKSMTTLHDPAKPTYMNSTTASKLREANGQIITPTVAFGTTTGLAIKKMAPLANPVPTSTTTSKVSGTRTMQKSTSVTHLKGNSHII